MLIEVGFQKNLSQVLTTAVKIIISPDNLNLQNKQEILYPN